MNEKQQLFEAVDKFAMLMKERFDSKRKQGCLDGITWVGIS